MPFCPSNKLLTSVSDLESGVLVTCDVGYLCVNFSLPIGLSVLDLGPMYATDVRRASLLNAIIMSILAR